MELGIFFLTCTSIFAICTLLLRKHPIIQRYFMWATLLGTCLGIGYFLSISLGWYSPYDFGVWD